MVRLDIIDKADCDEWNSPEAPFPVFYSVSALIVRPISAYTASFAGAPS